MSKSFDIRLTDAGLNKIHTIKALRCAFHPMSLADAKHIVDNVPVDLVYGVDAGRVHEIKEAFHCVAPLEITEVTPEFTEAERVNEIGVELPSKGPNWVDLEDFKLGEIVTIGATDEVHQAQLRIITSVGAMSLEGSLLGKRGEGHHYQRLPVGSKIIITIK